MKKQKLGIKLVGGFVLVALITLGVGFQGWRVTTSLGDDLTEVGAVRLPSVQSLLIIKEAFQALTAAQRALLIPNLDRQSRETQYSIVAMERERYQKARAIYEPLPQTTEEAALWKQFVPVLDAWRAENNKFFELSKELDQSGTNNEAL
jgi:methyl-accepting chemotaxis protein